MSNLCSLDLALRNAIRAEKVSHPIGAQRATQTPDEYCVAIQPACIENGKPPEKGVAQH